MEKERPACRARLLLTTLLVVIMMSSYGCTTFGTFSSLKPNVTTSDEVRELLGEPEEVRSEEDADIWTYTFDKSVKTSDTITTKKSLETEISFKGGVVKDYQISVVTSQETEEDDFRVVPGGRPGVTPGVRPGAHQGMGPGTHPGQDGLGPKARQLLEQFDKNRDRRISRSEFTGPEQLFLQLDRDHNNILDPAELNNRP